MLKELSSAQIAEWIAYYNLEPFGFESDWLQTGVITSMIANVNRKKGAKPAMPEDFIPNKRKVQKRQSVAEQRGILKSIAQWAKNVGKNKDA